MLADTPPLSIGPLTIHPPAVQAPLAGYTDQGMRLVARQCGAQFCYGEMILDKLVTSPGKIKKRIFDLEAWDTPVGAQICGREPDTMAEAARQLAAGGYDLVEMNLACPVRKVLRRERGGALLREPDQVRAIASAMLADATVPITAKLRYGYDDSDESRQLFWQIVDTLAELGVAAITIHGRSVMQHYRGAADWNVLAEAVLRYPSCRIIGSGDVTTPERARRMIDQTEVAGVVVARASLGNPWFFQNLHLKPAEFERYRPSPPQQRKVILAHFEQLIHLYGERRGCSKMRRTMIHYSRHHADGKAVRMRFVTVKTIAQFTAAMDELYPPE